MQRVAMLNWLSSFLPARSLGSVLNETKTVRVNGIKFKIKKIDPLNFLDGSRVMLQSYDTYKSGKEPDVAVSEKKVREHVSQVLVAGVAEPALSHKDDGSGFYVENLFVNPKITNTLYEQIIAFTYGKKKILNT